MYRLLGKKGLVSKSIIVLVLTSAARAAVPVLVKDINTNPASGQSSSFPANMLRLNNRLYFAATTPETGRELFVSDGSAGGTSLIRDINPGTTGSSPAELTPLDATRFVFSASDGTAGRELWISDGTANGTMMLLDVNTSGSSNPTSLTAIGGGVVVFWATDADAGSGHGAEVWRTDGTAAGTRRLSDIAPGPASARPSVAGFVAFAGKVFFAAQDSDDNSELWSCDGTNASSVTLVKEINADPGKGSAPQSFAVLGPAQMLFRADDGTHGAELWMTDGTSGGTNLLKDIQAGTGGSMPAGLTLFGGKAYFAADGGTGVGRELFVSDGTVVGTHIVKDIYAGKYSSNPRYLTVTNGKLFFNAADAVHGAELWVSDGTENGTTVIDSIPGITGLNPWNLCSVNFAGIGERLLFQGADFTTISGGGAKPWISDGTTAGTTVLKSGLYQGNSGYSPARFTALGGMALFAATDGSAAGTELWKTNGTSDGTALVADIAGSGTQSAISPFSFFEWAAIGNTLYFTADNGATGAELWKSDGSGGGTLLVKDIRPGATGSSPTAMVNGNGVLYFRANDGTNGSRLWRSDGTPGGTSMFLNNSSASLSVSDPIGMVTVGGLILFGADDGSGTKLWSSDGTAANTVLVLDGGGNPVANPSGLFVDGNDAYMQASGSSGVELYRYRGGVVNLVADINPTGNSSPSLFVKLGNRLIYRASDGASGTELWGTDLTTDATAQIMDINGGAGNSNPFALTVAGGKVYFTATDGSNGFELWATDGTAAGTAMVKDIRPGSNSGMTSTPGITAIGNKVVFAANDGSHGTEPWVSDGTTAGTFMLKDIAPVGTVNPGSLSFSSNTINIINANGTIYFQADDGNQFATHPAHGAELWKTDGTANGTLLAADIQQGAASSSPGVFRVAGNKLFFAANDGLHGVELYALDLTP